MDEMTLRLFDGLPPKSQEAFKAMIKLMSYGYTGGGFWNAYDGTIKFERKEDVVKVIKNVTGIESRTDLDVSKGGYSNDMIGACTLH